jgi:uncharacterized membrane protein
MKDSHVRSLAKAISWRILATFMTIVISYLITQEINLAIYIGIFEFISKVIFYYFHERLWMVVPFGIRRTTIQP